MTCSLTVSPFPDFSVFCFLFFVCCFLLIKKKSVLQLCIFVYLVFLLSLLFLFICFKNKTWKFLCFLLCFVLFCFVFYFLAVFLAFDFKSPFYFLAQPWAALWKTISGLLAFAFSVLDFQLLTLFLFFYFTFRVLLILTCDISTCVFFLVFLFRSWVFLLKAFLQDSFGYGAIGCRGTSFSEGSLLSAPSSGTVQVAYRYLCKLESWQLARVGHMSYTADHLNPDLLWWDC